MFKLFKGKTYQIYFFICKDTSKIIITFEIRLLNFREFTVCLQYYNTYIYNIVAMMSCYFQFNFNSLNLILSNKYIIIYFNSLINCLC